MKKLIVFLFPILCVFIYKIQFLRRSVKSVLEQTGFVYFDRTAKIFVDKHKFVMKSFPKKIKIVQLTDFHYNAIINQELIELSINETNFLEPDLVLLTGDFTTDDPYQLTELNNILSKIKSKYGVFAIFGNHDLTYKETLRTKLLEINIKLLENEVVYPLGKEIALVGLGEMWSKNRTDFQPEKAFSQIDANIPRLVMVHNPDGAVKIKEYRADLIFAGHTHGGTISIPGYGSLYPLIKKISTYIPEKILYKIPYSQYLNILENYNLAEGIHFVGENKLFVSRGIGTHPRLFRIFCSPEINYFEISPN